MTLSGTLSNNSKYVIVNSSIASSCYASANLSTSATEMAFNGNDAVGLFKNGTLIDVIGTFNGGAGNFSADETLRRKTSVTVPNTTFNKTGHWDVYSTDICSGIGNKTNQNTELINDEVDFKIHPNPSNGNFNIGIDNSHEVFSVEIFSTVGQKVFEEQNTMSSSISVSHLQKGIYLVKLTKNSKTITKKIVID